MALSLALALTVFGHWVPILQQFREVEARLSQFPQAKVAPINFDKSQGHFYRLERATSSMPLHRQKAHAAQLAVAEKVFDAWFALYWFKRHVEDAKNFVESGSMSNFNFLNVEDRVQASANCIEILKKVLGEENFRAGRMPPPVPYWFIKWN